MNLLMLTNVYTPYVGGIARSVQAFRAAYLARGHHVLIVAPYFERQPEEEEGVVRFPAVVKAYRNRYSLPLPIPGYLHGVLRDFKPDVIHSHHPFLLGTTAQRISAIWQVPLVYTHHTRYCSYLQSEPDTATPVANLAADLVWTLTIAYCELCDLLIAPSESIRTMLLDAEISRPIEVVPTGVDFDRFRDGDRAKARAAHHVPPDAFLVGHAGRLEPEKNLLVLAEEAAEVLARHTRAHFLLVGEGTLRDEIVARFKSAGVAERLHVAGVLQGHELVDSYHAMDVFAFASKTETQGMVLSEAMAAGVPVVALEGSGVNDLMVDFRNGRLMDADRPGGLIEGLEWVLRLSPRRRDALQEAARETARSVSMSICADRMLRLYEELIKKTTASERGLLSRSLRFLDFERKAWSRLFEAAGRTFTHGVQDATDRK
jgi:glycosyltransferase involved in cell wall biosynthesis